MQRMFQQTAGKPLALGHLWGLAFLCLPLAIAIAAGLIFWFANGQGGSGHDLAISPTVVHASHLKRNLVIIVPGTFENARFWPTLPKNNQVTFASELQRAAGGDTAILPFLWDGANSHCSRQIAAESLAKLIDRKAADFDQIYLVGHSHGGNIALMAAGFSKTRIAMVVCLATPHVTLEMRGEGHTFAIPCYCDWQGRQNIDTIVALYAHSDSVPDFWAAMSPGLKDSDAIALTEKWREHLEYPRLTSDGLIEHVLGREHFRLHKSLNIADANIQIHSLVTGVVTQHAALHSVRMGYVVGELLRDGPSPSRLRYIETLIQSEQEDTGEPMLQTKGPETSESVPKVWRLDEITIHLVPGAKVRAHNLDGTDPSPFVRITSSAGKQLFKSLPAKASYQVTWNIQSFLLWANQKNTLGVWADHKLEAKTPLGSQSIMADPEPPTSFSPDVGHGIYFSAELKWTAMHF